MNSKTIAFDIDGTLIHQQDNGQDVPNYDVIQLLHLFYEHYGWTVYLWSGSGVDYAKRWGEKLGYPDIPVIEKGSLVPDIAVDDEEVNLGKIQIQV